MKEIDRLRAEEKVNETIVLSLERSVWPPRFANRLGEI